MYIDSAFLSNNKKTNRPTYPRSVYGDLDPQLINQVTDPFMKDLKTLRAILFRPEIASICLVAFMADLVAGIVVPTFSLYATSLDASLALVGALTGMAGFTSIFASLPIGILSDAQGRKSIIVGGMFLFALSSFLYTIVPNPLLLFPIRILCYRYLYFTLVFPRPPDKSTREQKANTDGSINQSEDRFWQADCPEYSAQKHHSYY